MHGVAHSLLVLLEGCQDRLHRLDDPLTLQTTLYMHAEKDESIPVAREKERESTRGLHHVFQNSVPTRLASSDSPSWEACWLSFTWTGQYNTLMTQCESHRLLIYYGEAELEDCIPLLHSEHVSICQFCADGTEFRLSLQTKC